MQEEDVGGREDRSGTGGEPAGHARPAAAEGREADDFATRIDAHRGIVFRVANSYCPRSEERDDLVQEICLQLWRSRRGYDDARRFSTWMYRVALNTAISFARSARVRGRRLQPLDEPAAAEALAAPEPQAEDERGERLFAILHRLPELDRALVLLHLEERSYREIAEILGIGESNVGTRLSRIRQTLRNLARDEERDHGAR